MKTTMAPNRPQRTVSWSACVLAVALVACDGRLGLRHPSRGSDSPSSSCLQVLSLDFEPCSNGEPEGELVQIERIATNEKEFVFVAGQVHSTDTAYFGVSKSVEKWNYQFTGIQNVPSLAIDIYGNVAFVAQPRDENDMLHCLVGTGYTPPGHERGSTKPIPNQRPTSWSCDAFHQQFVFLTKLDQKGHYVWHKKFHSNTVHVELDNQFNTIVSGAEHCYYDEHGRHERDSFLAKYNEEGNTVWVKRFGPEALNLVHAVSTTGDVFVAGSFYESIDIDGNKLTSSGNRNVFVAQFSSDGTLSWYRHLESDKNVTVADISVDSDNLATMVGEFDGSICFDDTPMDYLKPENASSGTSAFMAKINSYDKPWPILESIGDVMKTQGQPLRVHQIGNKETLVTGIVPNAISAECPLSEKRLFVFNALGMVDRGYDFSDVDLLKPLPITTLENGSVFFGGQSSCTDTMADEPYKKFRLDQKTGK